MYYVAVDIGCLECGEPTAILGIFTDKKLAKITCAKHAAEQELNWKGQHDFEVFEIAEINKTYKQEY